FTPAAEGVRSGSLVMFTDLADALTLTYPISGTGTAKMSSSVTLGASPNPSILGASVTFTATVSGSAGTPTGSVAFNDGATTICASIGLGSGQAQCVSAALSAGIHSVTAAYLGDGNYAPSVSNELSLRVKALQSITFTTLPDKTAGDPPFTVSATASSGLAVAFSSLTTAICTVSVTTVTLVATGTCVIAANQAGDESF